MYRPTSSHHRNCLVFIRSSTLMQIASEAMYLQKSFVESNSKMKQKKAPFAGLQMSRADKEASCQSKLAFTSEGKAMWPFYTVCLRMRVLKGKQGKNKHMHASCATTWITFFVL